MTFGDALEREGGRGRRLGELVGRLEEVGVHLGLRVDGRGLAHEGIDRARVPSMRGDDGCGWASVAVDGAGSTGDTGGCRGVRVG